MSDCQSQSQWSSGKSGLRDRAAVLITSCSTCGRLLCLEGEITLVNRWNGKYFIPIFYFRVILCCITLCVWCVRGSWVGWGICRIVSCQHELGSIESLDGILLEFNYFQPLVHFISNKTQGKLLAAPILGNFKAIFNMKISYFHLSSYAYVRLITTCLAQPMFVSFVLMSTFTFIPFYYFNGKGVG